MAKRGPKPKPVPKQILNKPWPLIIGILFGLLLGLTVFFLVSGISPEIESHLLGTLDISMLHDSAGNIILYPKPGLEAAQAGVENFDVLLKIDGKPVSRSVDINQQISGRIGEPVTITVRKSDGSVKDYTLVRSPDTQKALNDAHLTPSSLTGILLALSLLVGFGFSFMAAYLILQRRTHISHFLAAFVLLLLPYSMNAVSVLFKGVTFAHLVILYSFLRVLGFFLASFLLFIFPNGEFVPGWTRWILIFVGLWAILYYIALLDANFLPGSWVDFIWVIIFAFGLVIQNYRYRRVSSDAERGQTSPLATALWIALAIYLVVWVLDAVLPGSTISNTALTWFYLIAEMFVDGGFLYLGLRLMLSIRKTQ